MRKTRYNEGPDTQPYDPLTEGGGVSAYPDANVDWGGGMYSPPAIPDPPQIDTGKNRLFVSPRGGGGGPIGKFAHPALNASPWFNAANTTPTAEQEALQQPMIDPVFTLAGMGGVGSALGDVPYEVLKDFAMQGGLGMAAKAIDRPSGLITEAPFAIPDWMQTRDYSQGAKYKVPKTDDLRTRESNRRTSDFNTAEKQYVPQGGYPEYRSKLPLMWPVGENPPKPEDLLYHGLSMDLNADPERATETALERARSIQETGLHSGWFAESPAHPFGPLFIGTRAQDLEDHGFVIDPRRHQLDVDPKTELATYKSDPYGKVPPYKLWLMDHEGNLLGRMAPEPGEPGAEKFHQSASEYWASKQPQSVDINQGNLFDDEDIANEPHHFETNPPPPEKGSLLPEGEPSRLKESASDFFSDADFAAGVLGEEYKYPGTFHEPYLKKSLQAIKDSAPETMKTALANPAIDHNEIIDAAKKAMGSKAPFYTSEEIAWFRKILKGLPE